VTLVFVVFDIVQVKFDFYGKWDPRTLPKLTKREPKHSMVESVAALVLGAIFGVWWLVGLKHQFFIFGPGVAAVHFGPVWQTLYPLFVVLVVADIIRHTIDVLRPGWERGRVAFLLFFRLMNLVALYFLLNATDLLVPGDALPAQLRPIITNLNVAIHLGLIAAAIVTMAQMAWDVYRFFFRSAGNNKRVVVSL
jgi:hypothetical protein